MPFSQSLGAGQHGKARLRSTVPSRPVALIARRKKLGTGFELTDTVVAAPTKAPSPSPGATDKQRLLYRLAQLMQQAWLERCRTAYHMKIGSIKVEEDAKTKRTKVLICYLHNLDKQRRQEAQERMAFVKHVELPGDYPKAIVNAVATFSTCGDALAFCAPFLEHAQATEALMSALGDTIFTECDFLPTDNFGSIDVFPLYDGIESKCKGRSQHEIWTAHSKKDKNMWVVDITGLQYGLAEPLQTWATYTSNIKKADRDGGYRDLGTSCPKEAKQRMELMIQDNGKKYPVSVEKDRQALAINEFFANILVSWLDARQDDVKVLVDGTDAQFKEALDRLRERTRKLIDQFVKDEIQRGKGKWPPGTAG